MLPNLLFHNEVVGVEAVVNEFDSSDTESNKGGSKSVSENDNESVVLKIVKRREQLGLMMVLIVRMNT